MPAVVWASNVARVTSSFSDNPLTRPQDVAPEVWVTRSWYRVLAYYFSIATTEREFGHYVETVLGRFATDRDLLEEHNPPTPGIPAHYELMDAGAGKGHRYRLYYNGVLMSSSVNAGDVFDHFFWHVNAESARRTGDFVLVHAGAIASPGGSGVLIPGASGTGKSTLVAGLLHEGFAYYSDEAAAIDPISRRLHSYPKAITLKNRIVFDTYADLPMAQTRPDFVSGRWYIVPSQIREEVYGPPTDVRFVILSRFEPGAETTVARVGRAEAAMALGRNVINIGRYRARVLPLLADLVKSAQCYSLQSGDLEEAVAAIKSVTAA